MKEKNIESQNFSKERSRIASAAEANRENLNSAAEYARTHAKEIGRLMLIHRKEERQIYISNMYGIVENDCARYLKKRDFLSYVLIRQMARDLKMKVTFVNELLDRESNTIDGLTTTQGVFININSVNHPRYISIQQFSHRIKQIAPKEWKSYQEFAIKAMKDRTHLGTKKSKYAFFYDAIPKEYRDKTDDYIHEEIAAIYIGELFENEWELVDTIYKYRGIGQYIWNLWNRLVSPLGIKGERGRARARWIKAYRRAAKQV